MSNFLTLVSIENMKLWKRLATKVMVFIIIALTLVSTIGIKIYDLNKTNKKANNSVSTTWKQDLQKEIAMSKAQIKSAKKSSLSQSVIGRLEKQIAEDEYMIKHNISPKESYSVWSKLLNVTGNVGYDSIIALMIIIACSALIAGEFSDGTMKMMISRPFSRSQILSSKLAATIIYGLELLAVAYVLNFVMVGILFGFGGIGSKTMLWTGYKIIYISGFLNVLILLGLNFLTTLFYTIVAFALSALFRSRSLATGFAIFLQLMISSIALSLAMFFSWGKYLPFAAVNFSSVITTGIVVKGMDLSFSFLISLAYAAVFCIIGYMGFIKRDI
ncbi:ABC transporter permease [Clostridium oryzae]|uniref:ABC-2 family transporter protein n=1 Tax=Clostridium oryzae TaxID=1450648 RepID=A0A1V4I9H8_9CLOT|nr:ABC transporter permease subunit [Clostridium oryzae]OPJ56606.1 ABC-2 family transporter protein [Clostridium oryzae]